jgi:hypothetical protein
MSQLTLADELVMWRPQLSVPSLPILALHCIVLHRAVEVLVVLVRLRQMAPRCHWTSTS